jgi:hypothetical protein
MPQTQYLIYDSKTYTQNTIDYQGVGSCKLDIKGERKWDCRILPVGAGEYREL